MCDIFYFFWGQGGTCSFGKKNKAEQSFLYKKIFYWLSCFKIGFYDDNVNQTSELTRDLMWKIKVFIK